MTTVYLSPELIARRTGIVIPPEKAHYLTAVLRSKPGDGVRLIDGCGRAYEARIDTIAKDRVVADIVGETASVPEVPVRTVLCPGLLKGEKMDLVVQKATELGVSGIRPVVTERSQVRATRKTGRWRKIAEEATEQCGRAVIPVVEEPATLDEVLLSAAEAKRSGTAALIACERGGRGLEEQLSSLRGAGAVWLCIGPEGGFSDAEVQRAEVAGLVPVSLGGRILRAETAAVAGLAVLHFLLERGLSRP